MQTIGRKGAQRSEAAAKEDGGLKMERIAFGHVCALAQEILASLRELNVFQYKGRKEHMPKSRPKRFLNREPL